MLAKNIGDKLSELEQQELFATTGSVHVSTRRKWVKLACFALLLPAVLHFSCYQRQWASRAWINGQIEPTEPAWVYDLLKNTGNEDALSSAELEKLFL